MPVNFGVVKVREPCFVIHEFDGTELSPGKP